MKPYIEAGNEAGNRQPAHKQEAETKLVDLHTPQVTKTEYEALAHFRYAVRLFLRFSEEAAQAAGLTPQQHQALLAIQGYPEREYVTVGELAERLQVRHHSAVGLIDRLVVQGLAVRQAGETDRRQVFVKLTPQGVVMLERLSAVHRQELRRIGPELVALITRMSGEW